MATWEFCCPSCDMVWSAGEDDVKLAGWLGCPSCGREMERITPDTTDTTDDEPMTEHIRRTDEGASIEVDITRGTGTRDQEKWKLKGKGASAEQALDELTEMLSAVTGRDRTAEGPLGDHVRGFQPDGDVDADADAGDGGDD